MTPGIAAALHLGGAAAAVRACRRRVRRGWARHLRWRAPPLTPLPWSLARHMPRASPPPTSTAAHCRERPMGHAAVWRAGSVAQGRADRLSGVSRLARAAAPHSAYRYAAPGRQRLLSTCVDNGARLLYICMDTCRHADTADGTRGHVTHPDYDPTDRLSVAEEAAMIDLATYGLEPLHHEGACLLYRGQPRTHTATPLPALLVVAPVGDHPAPASLQRLEHEYALRAALDPAWAVRPLALVPHQGRPVLVLEDPGGAPLTRLLGRPLALPQGLRLAIGLAVALGQLHGRGLIHKDVKPAHVFVNEATGQVWLMGFGIASPLLRERQAPEPPEVIAGTLAYMAPEQTGRMNRSIDARSDLYALGVTLYELLTGTLPFTAAEPLEWV